MSPAPEGIVADELTLKYDGGIAAEGELDAYSVGGAILAFGDFVGIVSGSVYHQLAEVRTSVRGLQSGSFEIEFAVQLGAVVTPLFGGPAGLFDYIKSAFDLIRHLQGEKPASVTEIQDSPGSVRVENNHGMAMTVYRPVVNIVFGNKDAQKALQEFVAKPLERGVQSVVLTSGSGDEVVAESEESGFFARLPGPLDEEETLTTTSERWLRIERVTFVEGRRSWRFSDGENSFNATVEDPAFLHRFESGVERFGMGDRLRVKVRTTQHMQGKEIKVQHVVEEVFEHKQAAQQSEMFPEEA